MATKIILDTRRQLKDGTFPLRIFVAHGTNLYLPTGLSVHKKDWNQTAQMCTGVNAKKHNSILKMKLTEVVNAILDIREEGLWGELSYSELRRRLEGKAIEDNKEPTLQDIVDILVKGKSKSTAYIYATALNYARGFCDPGTIKISQIANTDWVDSYVDALSSLKCNSKKIIFGKISSVMNYAERKGLISKNPSKDVHFKQEQTAKRSLTLNQLRTLRDMPLDANHAYARDIFMLIFYLIGINISDLNDAVLSDIVNGRLEYKRNKTGRQYSIKIEPEAEAIIKRVKRGDKFIRCSSQRIWSLLREISIPGVKHKITTYWARHTWATVAADIDISRDIVSECLGHSYGCSTTAIYIRFAQKKIDDANRRVINELNKPNNEKNNCNPPICSPTEPRSTNVANCRRKSRRT